MMSPLFVLSSSTVCCPSAPAHSLVFQHIWTLSNIDCMILKCIFSHWGQLRDSCVTITKGESMHWCSRRPHNAMESRWDKCTGRIDRKPLSWLLYYYLVNVFATFYFIVIAVLYYSRILEQCKQFSGACYCVWYVMLWSICLEAFSSYEIFVHKSSVFDCVMQSDFFFLIFTMLYFFCCRWFTHTTPNSLKKRY